MAIRKNFNPPGDCECRSQFNIEQTRVEITIGNVVAIGTFFLSGEICPDCDNRFSNLMLSFEDNDLTNGNQSFTLKVLAINPPCCQTVDFGIGTIPGPLFGQSISGIGLFKPEEGDPVAVAFTIELYESLTPDTDDALQFLINLPSQALFFSECVPTSFNTIAGGTVLPIPDDDLVIEEC